MFLSKKIQFTFHVVFIYSILNGSNCERIKDTMYETIATAKPCFRRMNATHQVGCSSKYQGSRGVIHFCTIQTDLEFILANGTADLYIPVVPTSLFTAPNLELMKRHAHKINGLLVYKSEDQQSRPEYYTHDLQCPNENTNLPNTCGTKKGGGESNVEKGESPIWNPHGSGLLWADIPFAVFYITDDLSVHAIRMCHEKFNNYSYETHYARNLCAVELSSFMHATSDTPTCVRRQSASMNLNPVRLCSPVGGENVYARLLSGNSTEMKAVNKTILVTARLDTTSMFDFYAGAASPVTGIVTLLSIADVLKRMTVENDVMNFGKNIVFVLFNGESYDYIGSQRFVYDLLESKSPLFDINQIELLIDLGQIADRKTLVAHTYTVTPETLRFIRNMRYNVTESVGTLPPSGVHSFLRKRPQIPAIFFSDHLLAFSNRFYNSFYDNASAVAFQYYNLTDNVTDLMTDDVIPDDSLQRFIGNVSEALAKALFAEITGDEAGNNIRADLRLIDELLECYLGDVDCKVHQAIQKTRLKNFQFQFYAVSGDTNLATKLIGLTLGWLTGDITNLTSTNCSLNVQHDGFKYANMSHNLVDLNTTKCFRFALNFTEAISPAFIIDDYNWRSGEYSSWSESSWLKINVRLYLQPSKSHEKMTLVIGCLIFLMSFIVTYFLKQKSSTLFPAREFSVAPQPTNC